MDDIIWIVIFIAIIIDAFIAYLMMIAANDKGYKTTAALYFVLCFLFPLFGHMCVIALPDKCAQEQNEIIIEMLEKMKKN